MKTKKIILPILVIVVSLVLLAIIEEFRPTAEAVPVAPALPVVELTELEQTDYPVVVHSYGTVESVARIRLISEIQGTVVYVSPGLRQGGHFEPGEDLVRLDTQDYELAVDRAEAQVASAAVKVAMESAEADIAERNWRNLGGEGSADDLVLRKPQLASAKSLLKAAEADLKMAQIDLERTRIKAPFAGRVRQASIHVGQFVNRGELLATIFAVDRVEVRLPLALKDLQFLDWVAASNRDAPSVEVELSGQIGSRQYRWHGQLVREDGVVNQRTRMLSVVAEVEEPYEVSGPESEPLRVGMFVEARIAGNILKQVYVFDRSLMLDNTRILAVDVENRLRIRELDILLAERRFVVAAGGFEPGDRLCVSGVQFPVDGMSVQPGETTGNREQEEPGA